MKTHELTSLTAEEADEMINSCNVDGDGKVNFDEFVKMMLS